MIRGDESVLIDSSDIPKLSRKTIRGASKSEVVMRSGFLVVQQSLAALLGRLRGRQQGRACGCSVFALA